MGDGEYLLRSHYAHFVCIVNELRPVYLVLEKNSLPVGALRRIVHRCSHVAKRAADKLEELPALTGDGRFLSRFLVRNCGNYLFKHEDNKSLAVSSPPTAI